MELACLTLADAKRHAPALRRAQSVRLISMDFCQSWCIPIWCRFTNEVVYSNMSAWQSGKAALGKAAAKAVGFAKQAAGFAVVPSDFPPLGGVGPPGKAAGAAHTGATYAGGEEGSQPGRKMIIG